MFVQPVDGDGSGSGAVILRPFGIVLFFIAVLIARDGRECIGYYPTQGGFIGGDVARSQVLGFWGVARKVAEGSLGEERSVTLIVFIVVYVIIRVKAGSLGRHACFRTTYAFPYYASACTINTIDANQKITSVISVVLLECDGVSF